MENGNLSPSWIQGTGHKHLSPHLAAGWQEDARRPYLVCPEDERQLTSDKPGGKPASSQSRGREELRQSCSSGFKPNFAESRAALTLGSALQSSPWLCSRAKWVLSLWHVNRKPRVHLQTSQVK